MTAPMDPRDPAGSAGLFAILYRPGPSWKAGLPLAAQDLADHAAYIRECAATGAVAVAGPLLDDTGGGLVIVRAEGVAQAKDVADADPAVAKGVFVATIYGWLPLIDPASRFRSSGG